MTLKKIGMQENVTLTKTSNDVTPVTSSAPKKVVLVNFANTILKKVDMSAANLIDLHEPKEVEVGFQCLTKTMDHVYIVYKSSKTDNHSRITQWMIATNMVSRFGLDDSDIILCDTDLDLREIAKLIGATHLVHHDLYTANKYSSLNVILADWTAYTQPKFTPDEDKFMKRARHWADIVSILTTGKQVNTKALIEV